MAKEATYERDGNTVSLFIAFYRDQKQGSELVNSMNRLVPERDSGWEQISSGLSVAMIGTSPTSLRTATVRNSTQRLRIWHFYWLDGRVETSDARAKLSLALDRLTMRTDTSAWVAIFTEADNDQRGDELLSAFARDMGPSIRNALAEAEDR